MTSVRSHHARRRRSAGPLAVALLLAVAGFVLALTIGAALHSQAEAVPKISANNAAQAGVPALSAVTETPARRAALSAVPQLPALHGVKERKAKKPKRKKATAPAPRRAAPAVRVTRTAPPAAPPRVAPTRPAAPPAAPQKKSPSFVGKGFDSSG
jgi:hypothetical protein